MDDTFLKKGLGRVEDALDRAVQRSELLADGRKAAWGRPSGTTAAAMRCDSS